MNKASCWPASFLVVQSVLFPYLIICARPDSITLVGIFTDHESTRKISNGTSYRRNAVDAPPHPRTWGGARRSPAVPVLVPAASQDSG